MRIILGIALAVLLCAPAASAQDLRGPDARDQSAVTRPVVDLRSPDARDLRSFPTSWLSDAAVRARTDAPAVTLASDDTGLDVRSATIGAGGALALAGMGAAWSLARRRRTASGPGVAPIGR